MAWRYFRHVRAYTDLPSLQEIVLEESYVLHISASPEELMMHLDFVLTPKHPGYAAPLADEVECFRRGRLRFDGVSELVWTRQGAPPAADATGEHDYGHVETMGWEGTRYWLAGDFGEVTVVASGIHLELVDDGALPPTR